MGNVTSRRHALFAAASSVVIGADDELIATCAAFCDLERAYDAPGFRHETGTPEGDAAAQERERIVAEQDVLVDRMCELPCTTLAGVQAMARALATWDRELLKDGPAHDVGEVIASNMVERLLALQAPDPDHHPDADLLAACADYLRIQRAWETYCVELDCDVENDDPNASMLDPLPALVDRIVNHKATTPEGHIARARCMTWHYLAHHPLTQDDPDGASEDRFHAALYRDLIAQERPEMQTWRGTS